MSENQAIMPIDAPAAPVLIGQDAERIKGYVRDSKAAATQRAYQQDWRQFVAWLNARGCREDLPIAPEIIAAWITELADSGSRPSTISRKVAAVGFAHRLAEVENTTARPLVTETMKGIRRRLKVRARQVRPLTVEDMRTMVSLQPATLAGVRNRALLLLGFAGAFRRSELVALNVEDIREDKDGLTVLIAKSKGDQEASGQYVGIPAGKYHDTCPVRAYKEWLRESSITGGPVFRQVDTADHLLPDRMSDRAVARLVKSACESAGLDPKLYSGHSLRAGFVTAAYRAGAREVNIMRQTRHRRSDTLQLYIRSESVLGKDNAARMVGL
ncbi:MAG: site-specific integrase [Armatimonadota bacterium]